MPDFLADALTWPSNYSYFIAVRTAMDLHLPPTVMIIDNRQPTAGWTPSDKKLAMAWTILQIETCKHCGQPLWICRSANKNLGFSVRTDTCYAKAELEKWEKGKTAKNLKPGVYPYTVPVMRTEEPLPSRKAYIKQVNDD